MLLSNYRSGKLQDEARLCSSVNNADSNKSFENCLKITHSSEGTKVCSWNYSCLGKPCTSWMTAKLSLPHELGFSCICNNRTMVLCRILNRSWENIAVILPVLQDGHSKLLRRLLSDTVQSS